MYACAKSCLQGSKGCRVSKPLLEDCPRAVEASERIGYFLWLRCRLALVRSLAAHIPDSATLFEGLFQCGANPVF